MEELHRVEKADASGPMIWTEVIQSKAGGIADGRVAVGSVGLSKRPRDLSRWRVATASSTNSSVE